MTILRRYERDQEIATCQPLVHGTSPCLGCEVCEIRDSDTECCVDSDCESSEQKCVSNRCIFRGNPSFELRWFGEGKSPKWSIPDMVATRLADFFIHRSKLLSFKNTNLVIIQRENFEKKIEVFTVIFYQKLPFNHIPYHCFIYLY